MLHFGNLKKPSQVIITFHLAFKFSCCSHIQRGNGNVWHLNHVNHDTNRNHQVILTTDSKLVIFVSNKEMQTHLNMSPGSSMFRCGLVIFNFFYPFMRWFRQVIRHGRIRSYGRNSLKKTGHFFSSVELIYATNMARPKWHNSFYTNIAQNQEISSRVLLFSRFDFDRSFSTALNPQIISIKKLLVHKKTHHQPTSKKSHNLSNMRNHNPRMFWSYPTVYDRMNGSFPSPQLAEFHLLDPPERMTSERQLHGPKVKNVMPRPEIHLYICNHLYVFIHRYTSFIKHHLLLIG